jgi:hypothetical protein
LLRDNTSRGNSLWGMVPGVGSGVVGNVLSDNTSGSIAGGIALGANSCDGSTASCP